MPQYRNAISLVCTTLGGAVLLVDGIYWLELFYTGPSNKCYRIYEAVKEGIKAVVNKFHYMQSLEDPEEQFYCSSCSTTEHFCRLSNFKTELTCYKDVTTVPINKTRQLPWFVSVVKGEFSM